VSATLDLARALLALPSVTPDDGGCQDLVAARLEALGFQVERLAFDGVSNLWARRGEAAPLVVFAGHTDVVPPGPASAWTSPPFEPTVRDGHLYGRGAADMKSSVAAFVTAIEEFVAGCPDHRGSIGVLLTSDEEGPAEHGTVEVLRHLERAGVHIDHCLVGEPTAVARLGDVIKIGRRGSLNGSLRVIGVQGHVAYPHLADNPVHRFAPALAALAGEHWDEGTAEFPPTTFQVSNVRAGTGATNVIPGELNALFNFRFSPALTEAALRERVHEILAAHGVRHEITWSLSGQPYLSRPGALRAAVQDTLAGLFGEAARASTDGGTSDGRFIAVGGTEVVELGPVNATIHQVDERIAVSDVDGLHAIYRGILERMLGR